MHIPGPDDVANDPLIVGAVGPERAREIAYRSFGNVIEDTVFPPGSETTEGAR